MELTEAKLKIDRLIEFHRLKGWGVLFENNPGFLGVCRTKERYITLQTQMVINAKSFSEVLPTVLHEIAHGLTLDEVKMHGPEWDRKLRSLIAYHIFGDS